MIYLFTIIDKYFYFAFLSWFCKKNRYVIGFLGLLVQVIEEETKYFIDESFKTLRSAEAAFDVLLNLKHIRCREAISKQMMMKFNDILDQYCKEVLNLKISYVVHATLYLVKTRNLCICLSTCIVSFTIRKTERFYKRNIIAFTFGSLLEKQCG